LHRLRVAAAILLVVFLASSCKSYTIKDGRERISEPTVGALKPTSLHEIENGKRETEEEKLERKDSEIEELRGELAKEREENKGLSEKLFAYQEKDKVAEIKQRMEEERASKAEKEKEEQYKAVNDFPESLDEIVFPHVYRPKFTEKLLSDAFTEIDVLLMPLGNLDITEERMSRIVSSTKDIDASIVVVTGSLKNQVEYAKGMGMDAVVTETGTILFNSRLGEATKDSVSFRMSPKKSISVAAVSLSDDMAKEKNLDTSKWRKHLSEISEESLDKIKISEEALTESAAIIGLSSPEPASSDWTFFTQADYREDCSFPISDYLNGNWSDTYADTHFSEETDLGVTLETSSITERLDFLYVRGLIEISSETLSVSGLSDGDEKVFALLAKYVMP